MTDNCYSTFHTEPKNEASAWAGGVEATLIQTMSALSHKLMEEHAENRKRFRMWAELQEEITLVGY